MKCPGCQHPCSDLRDICPSCYLDLRPTKRAAQLSILYPNTPYEELVRRLKEKQSGRGFAQGLFSEPRPPSQPPPPAPSESPELLPEPASVPVASAIPAPEESPVLDAPIERIEIEAAPSAPENPAPFVPAAPLTISLTAPSERAQIDSDFQKSPSPDPAPLVEERVDPPDHTLGAPIPDAPSVSALFEAARGELRALPSERVVELRSDQLLQADRDVILMFFDLAAEELRDPKVRLRRTEGVQSDERAVTSKSLATQLAKANRATELPTFSLRTGPRDEGAIEPTLDSAASTRHLRTEFLSLTQPGRLDQFGAALIDLTVIAAVASALVLSAVAQQRPDLLMDALPPTPIFITAGIELGLTSLLLLIAYPLFCAPFQRTVGMWALQVKLETEHGTRPSLEHLLVWVLLWPSALVTALMLLGNGRMLANRLSRTVIAATE